MILPPPIKAFFEADKSADGAAPIGAFDRDAVVLDEGKTHKGLAAIEAWWRAAKAQYHHKAEPREVIEKDGLTVVQAEVTGDFPTSPAMLTFAFRLGDDLIEKLEITA